MFLCFMLVYRALLHMHETLFFCPRLRGGANHDDFCFMLVYRALLDKHKTLNFDQLQARKKL